MSLKIFFTENKKILIFLFAYNQKLIDEFEKRGAKYSVTYKGWYIPYDKQKYKEIKEQLNFCDFIERFTNPKIFSKRKLSSESKDLISKFKTKLQAKNYSISSIRTYVALITPFIASLKVNDFSKKDVENYFSNHSYKYASICSSSKVIVV